MRWRNCLRAWVERETGGSVWLWTVSVSVRRETLAVSLCHGLARLEMSDCQPKHVPHLSPFFLNNYTVYITRVDLTRKWPVKHLKLVRNRYYLIGMWLPYEYKDKSIKLEFGT